MTKVMRTDYEWPGGTQILAASIRAISGFAMALRDQSGNQRLVINSAGVHLGTGTPSQGGGVNVVGLADATTLPTTNPAGGCVYYSEGGVLKVRQADGTVVTVANASGGGGGPVGSSRTSASAAISTTVTTTLAHTPAAGEIVAGSTYQIRAHLRVINTIAASNLVLTFAVGSTAVVTATVALGTTAYASPGRFIALQGMLSFHSTTSCEGHHWLRTLQSTALDTWTGTTAPVTVTAGQPINLNLNTSAATSTIVVREAAIWKVR